MNSTTILTAIGFSLPTTDQNPYIYKYLREVSVGNIILSAGGLIPGYYATYLLIDRWGRKPIQLMGFIASTILFIIMGATFSLVGLTS